MAAFGAEEQALRQFLTESRMMVAAATVKCAGCSFAVTGLTKSHCCVLCQRTPGKHGPRCERRLRKCKNCDYAVTMADCPHHCCKLCARGEEEHGPRCQRMEMPMSDDELDEDDAARIGEALPGEAPAQFLWPHSIATDSRGDIYVAEVSYVEVGSRQRPPREMVSLRKWRRVD